MCGGAILGSTRGCRTAPADADPGRLQLWLSVSAQPRGGMRTAAMLSLAYLDLALAHRGFWNVLQPQVALAVEAHGLHGSGVGGRAHFRGEFLCLNFRCDFLVLSISPVDPHED